ncbi:hypothetical protein BGX34_002118 [Mortierella sp. NVP85]|nr:hypothetical protein BGX34_002118 [Mortierella sp. NVP85]
MEKHWLAIEKRPTWVLYVRRDYQHVNTNNLLESWFRSLKECHLDGKRDQRPDFIIYLLQGPIERDLRMQRVKVRHGIQSAQLSQYDKYRKERAMEIGLEEARVMITAHMEKRKFVVKSFTKPRMEYTVDVDLERSLLLSCSCADHITHRIPCKHMYLVTFLDVGHRAGPMYANPKREEKTNIDAKFRLPPESVISPHLLRQLEAERTKEREQKKRMRDEATAQAFENCQSESQDLWKRLGRVVYGKKKRQCTLKDIQSTVEALREVVGKAEDKLGSTD